MTDPLPELVPAHKAAAIACCSSSTLARWAREGKLQEFQRDGYSARFYLREEVEKFRPQPVDRAPRARTP